MITTFNELRRIKDRLPSGSMQRIADEIQMKNARELDAGERAKLQREAERKQRQRNKGYDR